MKLTPWVGYSGSLLQNNFGEDLEHGYLVWDIDTKAKKHTVEFSKLPNPKPFVTVDWAGSVDSTFELANNWPNQSRFRIRSTYTLPSSDATSLSMKLRKEKHASEVTFKADDEISLNKFASASLELDVHSLEAMEKMLREYYSSEVFDDEIWQQMLSILANVHPKIVKEENINRGVVWTLKNIEFDNLYGYGENNSINFENKSGIVGIFGPNRIGKSSIVGSIMYSLFNSSDRDVGKNAYVVNFGKKTGSSKTVINVAGSDYQIERKTTKVISRGLQTANTTLALQQLDGDAVNLNGEQRADTEKNLRKLIGTYEDFSFTGGQVQDDVNRFLKEGATQRKAILSHFLGIDVFEKLYSVLNSELTEYKNKLKNLSSKDKILENIENTKSANKLTIEKQEEYDTKRTQLDEEIRKERFIVDSLQQKVNAIRKAIEHDNHIKQAADKHEQLVKELSELTKLVQQAKNELLLAENELVNCISWDEITEKQKIVTDTKLLFKTAESELDSKKRDLDRSKIIALKLLDVPCGNEYPSCVYIKDAHIEHNRVPELHKAYMNAIESHGKAADKLLNLNENEIEILKNKRKQTELKLETANKNLRNLELKQQSKNKEKELCKVELEHSEEQSHHDNDSIEQRYNSAFDKCKQLDAEIKNLEIAIKGLERDRGWQEATIAEQEKSLLERESLEYSCKTRELLVNAFSRRGIPNIILGKMLPTINSELDKILDGIVDFRVWLQADDDTNALDILLIDNAIKDGTRPLELGSGMERMVCSLALRVALSNLTTLPKPDFMIIDEGFGALDESNAVACVSLLKSLKKWFRFLIIISHFDIIKESVDIIVDVEKTPDGARVKC